MIRPIENLSAIALALTLGLGAWAAAQAVPLEARSLGMGRAELAEDGNASSAWATPALLALPQSQATLLDLGPGLNLGVGNNFLSFNSLNQLLTGQSLSDADMQYLTTSIPNSGLELKLDGGSTLGVSMPSLHTGLFLRTSLDTLGLSIPKSFLTLILQGNAYGTSLSIDSLQGARAEAIADAGGSFAIPFNLRGKPAALGVCVRYIEGLGFARVTQAQGTLLQANDDGSYSGQAHATYQYGTLGTGSAVDLSFGTDLRDDLRVVANLDNIGAIHWPTVTEKTYSYTLDHYQPGLSGSSTSFNTTTPHYTTSSADGPNNGHDLWDTLPLQVGMGMRWKPLRNRPFDLAADLLQGFSRGYGVSTQPELRVGGELKPLGFLPLRCGLSLGGDHAAIYTAGMGLDVPGVRVDFGLGSYDGMFSASKGAFYALSTQLKF